eukprot:TRINITY_DN662_c0_g1_i4.p1 TRINITY_DN662_c0_g1~~TRINITY_DN662_c0_g1_i4.p1  ORF type:complete len:586 (-),score=123.38 TRINITY_DN662_c0_g1_i4:443-2092(-)
MASDRKTVDAYAVAGEFVAMTLFVFFGCGSAMVLDGSRDELDKMPLPGWVLMVSLAFGLAIISLVYATAHLSGGHINCAVTLSLALTGNVSILQALANVLAQLAGSVLGACLLCSVFPVSKDNTHGLGSNAVGDGWHWHNALIGEIMGTFFLVYVVLQTACDIRSEANRAQAAIAIGLAVFVAHAMLIPIDGCSINPTRSFGPALVAEFVSESPSHFKDMWIFWVGPILGSLLATAVYKLHTFLDRKEEEHAAPASLNSALSEFIAMTLFVIVGCGSAMGVKSKQPEDDDSTIPSWVALIALVFGCAIVSLAYATGGRSGGHINCAVTLGLVLTGGCSLLQGVANFIAQMLGSIAGAAILCAMYPEAMDQTGGLGSNGVGEGWKLHNAVIAEIMGTLVLVYVVLQTALSPNSTCNRSQAAIAIGFSVVLAHLSLIPIDGCSINPTRSFGPAVMAQVRNPDGPYFRDMWIFWLGPVGGAVFAAALYNLLKNSVLEDKKADTGVQQAEEEAEARLPQVLLGRVGAAAAHDQEKKGNVAEELEGRAAEAESV